MKHEPESPTHAAADDAWAARVRVLLDEWEFDLDAATASRLNRARQTALGALPGPSGTSAWRAWLGGGVVAAGLALLILRLPNPVADLPPPSDPGLRPEVVSVPPVSALSPELVAAPDFEMLTDAERLALLEDLEFYAWLDAQDRGDG